MDSDFAYPKVPNPPDMGNGKAGDRRRIAVHLTDEGSRMLPGTFNKGNSLISLHGRKVFKKCIKRITRFQVVPKRFYRHTRTLKYGRAPEDVFRAGNNGIRPMSWHGKGCEASIKC